ncbi:MAG: VWA domain-containing protein, partial [Blastocatellia bacterium]|nr:VWA domain-containing protein [Blastocatellia bacterium]
LVAERRVELAASGENLFLLPQRNEQKGFYTYRAEVEALQSDSFVQNNSREAFALVEGRPKTLYLYGDPQPSPAVTRVLTEGGFAADVRSAASVPRTLAGFQDYDLVIFDNVPADALTSNQMKMVQAYVRDLGGGFIMIGGDQSFGPGGYYKTPVEETLPVSLDVRQKKHFPSLAIVLVIDRSGSMSGGKIQLAVEAASATVDFLSERDSVGVIAFDNEAHPVVTLTLVEDKPKILNQVAGIQARGGTNMYPGLSTAYDWLKASEAQIKHIIVLSDGQSVPGDFPGIARSIREAGMTLSAVAVGEDADLQMMKFLAREGGGRFYATDSPENLLRIFTREAFLASRSTIIEEPFAPRLVRPTQATAGIDWSAAPQLGGYVGTAERGRDADSGSVASPAITSLISDKDDPVYAVWQYGLGRAAAFTSDAKPRWAAGWMSWSGFGQFWTQMMRDTLRRLPGADLIPRVEINAGKGHIRVEAISPDGGFRNNLRLRAHIVAPDFSSSELALEQTAAGRYEGDFAAAARGAYLVSVIQYPDREGGDSFSTPTVREGFRPAPVTGSVNSYSPEFSITASDADLLARISEATGGSVIQTSDETASPANAQSGAGDVNLFERRAEKTRPREIWEALVLAALLILPFDVGIRRVYITREQFMQARARIASKLRRRAAEPVDAERGAALAQLKDARARVHLGGDDTGAARDSATTLRSPDSEDGRAREAQPKMRGADAGKRDKMQAGQGKASRARRDAESKTAQAPVEEQEAQPLASRLLDARRKKRG